MQTIPMDAPAYEAKAQEFDPQPERKLTKEELIDLVGAGATRGEDLSRAEREALAWQLVRVLNPVRTMLALEERMVAFFTKTRAERHAEAEILNRKRKPPRQPPPGKTWQDMVIGQWPGNETDEEIKAFLEEIS